MMEELTENHDDVTHYEQKPTSRKYPPTPNGTHHQDEQPSETSSFYKKCTQNFHYIAAEPILVLFNLGNGKLINSNKK